MVLTLGFLLELYQPLDAADQSFLEGLMYFRGMNQNCGGFFESEALWVVGLIYGVRRVRHMAV